MKKYNLEKFGPLILVMASFTIQGANHDAYDDLNIYIKENKKRIDDIVELFGNPNAREEELFEIIDKGISDAKRVLSDQFSGGAIGIW